MNRSTEQGEPSNRTNTYEQQTEEDGQVSPPSVEEQTVPEQEPVTEPETAPEPQPEPIRGQW